MISFVLRNKALVIITFVYLLTFVLMLPLRNVSFFDDFAYIHTVERFVKTGILKISDWTSTTLVFPVLWGSLFAKIFGFSIKILHLSNIILFYFGLLAFYSILRSLKIDEKKSIVFSLFLLGYPWVFSYLYTFMTDVFYVSVSLISVFFYIKGFKSDKNLHFLLGSFFAGLAFLTRQIGVIIPISILPILLLKQRMGYGVTLKTIFYSLAPALFMVIFYYRWIIVAGIPAAGYIFFYEYTKKAIISNLIPEGFTRMGVTNRLYIDLLLKRPTIYFISIINHLFPLYFIFAVKRQIFLKFLQKNRQIIVKTMLAVLFYLLLVYLSKQEVFRIPYDLLGSDRFVSNWHFWWKRITWISLPFWIFLLSLAQAKFKKSFLTRRRSPLISSKIALIGFITTLLFIYIKSIIGNYSADFRTVPYSDDPNLSNKFIIAFHAFQRPEVWLGTLKETWLVLILLVVLFFVLFKFLLDTKIKLTKSLNLEFMFLGLILFGNFTTTAFLAHSQWEEYTIAWIPFILIFIVYTLRKVPLSFARTTVLLILTLFFSVHLIRNRYQDDGVRWELGTKLVNAGVEPSRIGGQNSAWLRYWLWEDAFERMVYEKYGGDKYKVEPVQFDPVPKRLPEGEIYVITDAKSEGENLLYDGKPVDPILISEPFWIFDGGKIVKYRQYTIVKIIRKI